MTAWLKAVDLEWMVQWSQKLTRLISIYHEKGFRKKFTDKKAKVTRVGVRNKRSLFSISKKYISSSCFGIHVLFRLESQRSFWIYVKQEYLLTVQKGQWKTQQVNPKSSGLFQIKSFRSLSPTINAKFQKSTSYSHTIWHFCKCKSYIYISS